MITTITMNVAIDKAYRVDDYEPGKVLRVKECSFTPGGKGLNVARVLKAMGEAVLASGFTGGHAGAWVEEELHTQCVNCDFERVDGETRTCINIIEDSGRQTEFLEPGFIVADAQVRAFEQRFERLLAHSDVVTISGSVPRGCDTGIYTRLIRCCRERNVPVLLDTSGALLIEGASALPTLIKPNTDEISQLLAREMTIAQAPQAARELHERGIANVVISLGGAGSILACDEGMFIARPPKVQVKSATGCGDSMLAGLALGIKRGLNMAETLGLATAIAAANAIELGTGCVNPDNVPGILHDVTVERIDE